MDYIADRKENKSYKIFDSIAPTYSCINTVLSLGMDRYWRWRLLREISVQGLALDIACGTGDLSNQLTKRANISKVIGIDLSKKMLEVANKKRNPKLSLIIGDGQELKFPDNHFDLITIAFGIRNFGDLALSLNQIHRVLKSGGQLLILEFSMPANWLLKKFYLFYLRYILPLIGGLLSCNLKAYRYLNQTIESFPCGDHFINYLNVSGFIDCKEEKLSLGTTTLYQGRKR